tara:strand:+ start:311 stop:424 length:114 start_codon:yes stop_codon:yes gene_type:complete
MSKESETSTALPFALILIGGGAFKVFSFLLELFRLFK